MARSGYEDYRCTQVLHIIFGQVAKEIEANMMPEECPVCGCIFFGRMPGPDEMQCLACEKAVEE
jgi:hypothetical protein